MRSVPYQHARCHISHGVSQAETEIIFDSRRTDRTPLMKFMILCRIDGIILNGFFLNNSFRLNLG